MLRPNESFGESTDFTRADQIGCAMDLFEEARERKAKAGPS